MKRLLQSLKIVLACTLILALFWFMADWQSVGAVLLNARPLPLLACLLIYYTGIVLSCLKWRYLLRTQQIEVAFSRLIRWYLLGALASTLLPSSIGGDLGRAYIAGRALNSQAQAWASVFVERLTGLLMMLLMALVVLIILPNILAISPLIPFALVGIISIGLACGIWILQALPAWIPARLRTRLEQIREIVLRYQQHRRVMILVLLLSLVFHILNGISVWMLCLAVEPQATPLSAVAWPLIGITDLLPLTPGGLGVREGAMTLLLGRFGLSNEEALAASLLSRMLLLLGSLAGLPGLIDELRH